MSSCSASKLASSASYSASSWIDVVAWAPAGCSSYEGSWETWLFRMHSQDLQYRNCSSQLSSLSKNCSIFLIFSGSSSLSSIDFWDSSFFMRSLCWPLSKYLIACSLYIWSLSIFSIFSGFSVFCAFSYFEVFWEFLAEFCNWVDLAGFFGVLSLLFSGCCCLRSGSEAGLSPAEQRGRVGVDEVAPERLTVVLWLAESVARAADYWCVWTAGGSFGADDATIWVLLGVWFMIAFTSSSLIVTRALANYPAFPGRLNKIFYSRIGNSIFMALVESFGRILLEGYVTIGFILVMSWFIWEPKFVAWLWEVIAMEVSSLVSSVWYSVFVPDWEAAFWNRFRGWMLPSEDLPMIRCES